MCSPGGLSTNSMPYMATRSARSRRLHVGKNDENEKSASLAAHTGPRYCHGNQLSSAGRAGSEELSESDLVLATL